MRFYCRLPLVPQMFDTYVILSDNYDIGSKMKTKPHVESDLDDIGSAANSFSFTAACYADTSPSENEIRESTSSVTTDSKSFDQRRPGCCKSCGAVFRPCLTEFNPLPPANATTRQRMLYAVRCPPHGFLAHKFAYFMTFALMLALVYCVTVDMTLFLILCILALLVNLGTLGGLFVEKFHLPSLLGKKLWF